MFFFQTPNTIDEWLKIAQEFEELWNFPNCIGALDGKHVVIQAPANSGSVYFNYKGTHSIVLLAVVDARCRFLFVDIGCNGRVSDGGVYNQSALPAVLEGEDYNIPGSRPLKGRAKPVPFALLADDAFAMTPRILKPFPFRNQPGDIRVYNYRHSRARRIVENSFAHIANKFRVLRTPILLSPENTRKVVAAICTLHNFLLARKTNYIPAKTFDTHVCDERVPAGVPQNENNPGNNLHPLQTLQPRNVSHFCKEVRDELKNYFMSPDGEVEWQYRYI